MIISSVLLAYMLSQGPVDPSQLDMTFKECKDRYEAYLSIKEKDYIHGVLYGENLKVLCTRTDAYKGSYNE